MDVCGPSVGLIKLRDTEFTVSDYNQDIRSLKVVDEKGDDLGFIDDLIVDEKDHQVRFIEVNDGGLLGMGKTITIMPVESIIKLEDNVVYVCHSKECVCGAPKYNPELREQEQFLDFYSYYGYDPFWQSGNGDNSFFPRKR